jgi:hypothetical protein
MGGIGRSITVPGWRGEKARPCLKNNCKRARDMAQEAEKSEKRAEQVLLEVPVAGTPGWYQWERVSEGEYGANTVYIGM